jgi:hypothetical protein
MHLLQCTLFHKASLVDRTDHDIPECLIVHIFTRFDRVMMNSKTRAFGGFKNCTDGFLLSSCKHSKRFLPLPITKGSGGWIIAADHHSERLISYNASPLAGSTVESLRHISWFSAPNDTPLCEHTSLLIVEPIPSFHRTEVRKSLSSSFTGRQKQRTTWRDLQSP